MEFLSQPKILIPSIGGFIVFSALVLTIAIKKRAIAHKLLSIFRISKRRSAESPSDIVDDDTQEEKRGLYGAGAREIEYQRTQELDPILEAYNNARDWGLLEGYRGIDSFGFDLTRSMRGLNGRETFENSNKPKKISGPHQVSPPPLKEGVIKKEKTNKRYGIGFRIEEESKPVEEEALVRKAINDPFGFLVKYLESAKGNERVTGFRQVMKDNPNLRPESVIALICYTNAVDAKSLSDELKEELKEVSSNDLLYPVLKLLLEEKLTVVITSKTEVVRQSQEEAQKPQVIKIVPVAQPVVKEVNPIDRLKQIFDLMKKRRLHFNQFKTLHKEINEIIAGMISKDGNVALIKICDLLAANSFYGDVDSLIIGGISNYLEGKDADLERVLRLFADSYWQGCSEYVKRITSLLIRAIRDRQLKYKGIPGILELYKLLNSQELCFRRGTQALIESRIEEILSEINDPAALFNILI
jgi:hypothetical protein